MAVAELTVPRPDAGEGWLSARRARAIGWTAFAIGTALRVVQLWLASRLGPDSVPFAFGIGFWTFVAAVMLGTAAGLVGAIIVARRPGNVVGWLYVVTGLMQGVVSAGLAYAALTLVTAPDAFGTFMAWLNGVIDHSVPFAFAALVLALFPDGRLVASRWRFVLGLAVVGGAVRALEVGFGEASMALVIGMANPYRFDGPAGDLLRTSARLGVGSLLVEASFVLAAVSLAARYRAAELDGRRQIRWLLGAGFLAVICTGPILLETAAPDRLPPHFDALALLFASLTLAPIATLIAITRYRLYEIDRIVNRALLYGALTAILAGVFTAGIGLAQRLFVAMTGVTSDAAIVLATLVVATLYAPLRKRLEAFVDRRFKFDQPRFGAYRHEIGQVLSLVDPQLAAERLIREAVADLEATGGAILATDGGVTASAGTWPGPADRAALGESIPIEGGPAALSRIALGPRADGSRYRPADLIELAAVAGMVARAVRAKSQAL